MSTVALEVRWSGSLLGSAPTSSNKERRMIVTGSNFKLEDNIMGYDILGELRLAQTEIQLCLSPLFKEHDINDVQWSVIRGLNILGKASGRNISEQAFLKASSMTRILDRLREKKLVVVRCECLDRRKLNVRLSKKGQKLHEIILPLLIQKYKEIQIAQQGKKSVIDYEYFHGGEISIVKQD